ncbi:UTP--glucose-1-phosphate uridylyltransferase [Phycisphaerales bacterium AB-hyl4]|uniref:UTP--glucose-1-phosphate uridylyltransferase n=1 Tax=Natronomicrosphaera hydrolytica TaxID=3242702 RepID=A0ABV4U9X7_9BACT
MPTTTLTERYAAAKQSLEAVDQAHVLQYFDELTDDQQDRLLAQIESVDWPEVHRLIESHVRHKPEFKLPDNVEPAPWYPNTPPADLEARYRDARAVGEQLIRDGKVAAFVVAGGQGTRLGWDGPKGTFPATPIRKLPLFACFAEYIRKTQSKFGSTVPFYVMTSPINDADTRAFFKDNNYFGLDPANVMIFPQGMMPAIDRETGKVLLADRDELALSPNGHGGSLKALYSSGAIADMQKRGIEHISYIQVDNPIVKVIDPLFLGLHAQDEAQMSSKMLPKAYAKEKLGNFCLVDGKMTVIEYSDLPDALAEARQPDGELRFRAGSIALHAMRVDFVESLNKGGDTVGFNLPFHRAEKKVAYLDSATGQAVTPDQPNAVKLETFVFDALPMCDTSILYETDRIEEFAPIKNAEGVDSPASSYEIQIERAARWLEAQGVTVPRRDDKPDATLEISQLTAIEASDLKDVKLPEKISPKSELLL